MAQSRFVSLTPYCVVEYQFEPLGSLNFYSDDFIFVENSVTGGHQIFNTDSSYPSIKNVRDLNAISIGNNTYAYLDSEKIPNYLAYDPNLTSTTLSGYNVVLDNVRFHFVAGFDFDDFKALILSIVHTENNGTNNVFANVLLAPETITELIIFNPRPLFLSNAVYDRYIDILVPSIKNINETFVTSPVPSTTFSAAITPGPDGPVGFIYNNPITISLLECGLKKTIYTNTSMTYDAYEVSEVFTATLSQSNEFDNVGAYVNESIAGDYLEFYLTFNTGFPGELISLLNNRNPADDWIIIHQLSIFEQVGTSFINTSRLVFFQEDLYDEPNIFRPVLKNAHEAISMAVDYVARLTNRRNGEQIIREGSFSLIAPKKYGKNLINLPLLDKPQSQKVYNKIIKNNFEATPLFIEPTPISQQPVITPATPATQIQINEVVRTEFIPIFFNNSNISISNVSSMSKTADASEEVIFGPGKLRFVLSPFDNVIKLKVFTEATLANATNPLVALDLNVNAPKYRLVFETTSGKISVDNANDSKQENLSTGQLAFNVSKKDSEAISNSKNKTVYLVSVSQDGRETLIYTGEWRKPSEQADVDTAISQARESAESKKGTKKILENIKLRLDSISKIDLTNKLNLRSNVKEKAVVPIVNKFGVSNSKSIQATSLNTKKKNK
jgi:hypothetical protein